MSGQRKLSGGLVGVGVVIVLIVGFVARQSAPESNTTRQARDFGVPALPGGVKVDSARATTVASFPVELPAPDRAGVPTAVWYRGGELEQVFVEYPGGFDVSYNRVGWGLADPKTHYQSLAEAGIPGEVTEVAGWPAFVISPKEGSGQVASVGLVADGIEVQVVATSPETDAETLIEVASDIGERLMT